MKATKGRIAPMRLRIVALMIDYLVILGYGLILWGASFLFKPVLTALFTASAAIAEITGAILITLPITLYFILCESSRHMGSIGKRKMGLAVTNDSGERIRFRRSFTRTIIKFIPWELAHFAIWRLRLPSHFSESYLLEILFGANIMVLLYIIMPVLNKDRKSLYDWIAGTMVISISTKPKSGRESF
jgi:uncharacterized RDD family membrane protein YckC